MEQSPERLGGPEQPAAELQRWVEDEQLLEQLGLLDKDPFYRGLNDPMEGYQVLDAFVGDELEHGMRVAVFAAHRLIKPVDQAETRYSYFYVREVPTNLFEPVVDETNTRPIETEHRNINIHLRLQKCVLHQKQHPPHMLPAVLRTITSRFNQD